ncbi:hypothetical protein K435DRAFT_849742 [Dendrothele bispora CBS 962.96]|uniref:Uncharacterized protein n=1 Tax=Dendrothele bispora (strain CBS 962.96) TaxID=1314807 RepID=A0A4S8MRL2_DENBC|nr:hypothetical protein K435DRAFT_849742 [Dendrothele bispora CBS 962.96]
MFELKKTVEDCHETEIHLSLPEDDSEAYIKVRQKYSRIRMQNNILQFTFSTMWTYLKARTKIVKSIVECYRDASALDASLQVTLLPIRNAPRARSQSPTLWTGQSGGH